MKSNKKHYYDGKLYALLIDPALKEIRQILQKQIKADSNVIDIGCGTGALVFSLASHCNSVTGVELSVKMVQHANEIKKSSNISNINFVHHDATDLQIFKNKQFDYAVFSMIIHEMPPAIRSKAILEAKRIANQIIIADYTVPQPFNLMGFGTHIIEFVAGIDHFKNFRDFQKNNGLKKLLNSCQLQVIHKSTNRKKTTEIVMTR